MVSKFHSVLARLGVLAFTAVLVGSCDKPEPIPSWVIVEAPSVETFPGQGTAMHQLTEVYVYTKSSFLGVFPLPARIPVLEEGSVQLDLFPGIRANGIKAFPDIYPFLARYRQTLDLVPGSFDTIRPVFTYDALARIRFVEDFEGGIKTFGTKVDGNPLDIVSGAEVLEGAGSGRITLDTIENYFEIESAPFTDVPDNGTPVYLEIQYRNEVPFFIGLSGSSALRPTYKAFPLGLNPSKTWNKVYVNLTDILGATQLDVLRINLGAALPEGYPGGKASIWIDNIKLVHQ